MKSFTTSAIIKELKKHKNPKNVAGMARFGINPKGTLGISMPFLRVYAKKIGKNHRLALELWETGIHEARILSGLIAEPQKITEKQMDKWVGDFDSWDVCDTVCLNIFDKTDNAYIQAKKWAQNEKEFTRRAGFALMASLAVHDKEASDEKLLQFFPYIEKYSDDDRNFVRKAVNWALRQIGKRNLRLCRQAMALSKEILKNDSKAARWIAIDAIRELEGKIKKF